MEIFSFTEKGPRNTNQDFFLIERIEDRQYLMVADGVGGNKGGEVASQTACESFLKFMQRGDSMAQALEKTHAVLRDMGGNDDSLNGMATTFSCVEISNLNVIHGIHVGDSRIYQLRNNGIKQITQDHSEVERLLKAGKLTKEEAYNYPRKNVIYSALGMNNPLSYQEFEFDIKIADRIMIMSDGIYSVISKQQFRNLSVHNADFNKFCDAIVSSAAVQTKDNFTLVGALIV
jgi:serine/threonine protein phosphatase PrpC